MLAVYLYIYDQQVRKEVSLPVRKYQKVKMPLMERIERLGG